jgi:hypothetical protein
MSQLTDALSEHNSSASNAIEVSQHPSKTIRKNESLLSQKQLNDLGQQIQTWIQTLLK